MNRFKRYLAAPVVVLAMVAALLTGCANNTPAPESAAGAAELEIVSVTTDTSTSTAASTHVTAVTYKYNGEEQTATAAEGVLTLVVDGAQKDIKEGITFDVESGYSFTDIAVVNSGEGAPPWEPNATPAKFNFRQALYVTDGAIQANASVTDAIQGGTYTDTSAEGVTVKSDGPFFNGIYIHNSDYSIKDLTMSMTGDGGNDFGGWGAGVMSDGTSKLTIDGAVINTVGVIRTAVWAGDDSELTVKNSVISAYESPDTQEEYDALVPPMMKRVPFALGLEGVVRATNVLGAATAAYEDSIVVSSGWGVLSTDSGRGHDQNNNKYALNIKNVLAGIGTVEMAAEGKEYTATKEVNGVKYGFTANGSGYVAYADSGVWDQFDKVEFYSPDYVQIMASQNSSAFYKNSQLYSDRIMIMTQQNAGGLISIEDSKADVKDTFVQIKSGAANKGYTDVYVSNTEVNVSTENPWGGNLLELVESDDAGNPGVTEFAVNDTGDNATLYTSLGTIEDSNATFANGTYKGNIWNNIYNYTEALNVTLDNASLEGQVSASYGYHSDDEGNRLENGTILKSCTAPNYLDPVTGSNGDYLKIGAFINVPNKVVNNPINLTITNGSKWTVTGEANYLAALTVDALENIESASKTTVYSQTLTVGGEAKADGTYENGNVTIIVEAAPVVDLNTDTLATTQDYSGLHAVTFKAVDAAGNPMSKGVAFSYKAFTTIDFTAKAKSGYKVESVTCSDEAALKDNGDGSYTLENLKEAANTVTIVVAESDEPEQGGMMPGGPMPGGDGQMPGGDGQMPGGDGQMSGGDGQMPEGTPPEGTPPDGFGGGTQGPPPDAQ